MLSLVLLFACGEAPTPPHAHDDAGHAHGAPAAPAPSAAHDATPHAHASGHGGEVKVVGDLHLEARFVKSGLMLWLRDAAEQPVELATVTAGAVIRTAAGIQSVPLSSMGDHLHASLALEEGTPADAVVTITVQGKAVSADFRTERVGALAEHDHTPLHGGVVGMWGDHHVEYVAQDGDVRFYVSDAHRVAVREGVRGAAKVGDVAVPLVFDPASGLLSGKAAPAPGQRVTLDVTVGETSFTLAFGG